MLIAALLLPATLLAAPLFTDGELQKEKKSLTSLREAHDYADQELGPCVGLERLRSAMPSPPPAKTCPVARNFYDHLMDWSEHAHENCLMLVGFLEANLHDPIACNTPDKNLKAHLLQLRQDGQRGLEEADTIADLPAEYFSDDSPRGEMRIMDCRIALEASMQFRKWETTMLNKHYGHADMVTDGQCNSEDTLRYQRYVDGGDRGWDEEEPSSATSP